MIALLAVTLTVSAATPVLTLDEVLQAAGQNSLDLKVARARLEQTRLLSNRAWAAYLPTVSVGASYTRNSNEAVVTLPGGPQIVIQPYDQLAAQAEVRQAIIAPSLIPAIRNAGIAEDVAELSTENVRREILFVAAQAYFAAAAYQEAIRATQFLLDVNKAREGDTQKRFDAGTVTKVALLRAQLDRARAEQDLVRARNAFASSRLALATLIQRDPDFTLELPPVPQVPAQGEDLVKQALEKRPDVAAARRNLDLALGRKQGVWFSYAPSVGFSGVYRISNAAGFTGQNDVWALTLSAQWLLWDGGTREINLREESARVAEASAQQKQAEARVVEEVLRAQLEVENARANLTKAEEALGLARETQRLTEISFKAGVATYLEVADANSALTNAEVGAISERLQASLAALRLLRAAGSFAAQE
ncbi:outer membrane protein TolC [Archangium gephyra]|uniref:Heavy metal RND efflux outer membrane protein, CzcC family n=1 Tax=Archangium gephyra TaxID=48 RepID=A0AAC8Q8Y3_9BACT|nr:TolC family protein [Archangium gephyra]AKJ03035.1 Heavy metal RND efflux outer membrane protein, CzcC family [Archangium gephyra]REG25157.1 outer membrane protein TolC [Archangium gephyra]